MSSFPSSVAEHNPRSTPSEALEEFLSILHHPATIRFRPTSPLVMATNQATHFFTYRRQTPCSLSPSHPSEGLGLTLGDHADDKENEGLVYPFRILGSSLGTSMPASPYPIIVSILASQGHLSLACRRVTPSIATPHTSLVWLATCDPLLRCRLPPRSLSVPRPSRCRPPRLMRWSSTLRHRRYIVHGRLSAGMHPHTLP